MSDVVNINKSGWCALCCSNFCYCSPESLKRQVRHLLDTVKERNERIDRLEAMCEKIGSAAVKLGIVKDLYNPDYIPSVRDLIDAEDEFRKILEEYRAYQKEKK